MAKKKNKISIGKIALFATALLTIASIVMAFLGNLKITPLFGDPYTVSGFDIMFGWKKTSGDTTVQLSNFSIGAFFAYLLPILGLVTALIFNKSKVLNIIPIACFIAGAVLAFLMPNFLLLTEAGSFTTIGGEISLGYAAIITGVASAVSAVAVAAKVLLD